jgi:FxsC-like protein
MPYSFFLSYARGDMKDVYAQKFLEQLREEVEGMRPEPQVAFVDQREIESGEEWEASLVEALQTSATFVCLSSPRYFQSEYCGKEWAFFRKRVEAHRTAAETGASALPAVIKPIIWIPSTRPLPPALAAIQFAGQMTSDELKLGLRRLLMNDPARARVIIQSIADEIVSAANQFAALGPLPDPIKLADLPAFPPPGSNGHHPTPGADVPPAVRPSAAKEVKFVFVAPPPEKFPSGLRASLEAYIERGGKDWKPFFPTRRVPIRVLAQRIVSEDGMDLYFDELECDEHLMERLEAAKQARNIVVIVVDSWTTCVPEYRKLLEALDGWRYRHCTVVVPWNDADPETVKKRGKLHTDVRESLYFSSRNLDVHYNDTVSSEEQLKAWLRTAITELRGRLAGDTDVEIEMPLPPAGSGRPSIRGPGAGSSP